MRILMLGNSFTYFHDMPQILAALLPAQVVAQTRGGAFLAEQLDPQSELGEGTLRLLREEKWDYVVLQDHSRGPSHRKELFQETVDQLCPLIRAAGAKPILYATWAYKEGTDKLASINMTYDDFSDALYASYHEAAERNGALIADVGRAFDALRHLVSLYEADDYHPSEVGSLVAAQAIARVIEQNQ